MSVALSTLLPDQPLPAAVAARLVSGLSQDSRRLQPGEVFIAVPGVQGDGRQYIDAALHAGAHAVLTESGHASLAELAGVPIIGVPGLHKRVGEIAAHFYGEPAKGLEFIAVTGTNGKTSTSWFLRDALAFLGRRVGLVGTFGMQCHGVDIETGHTTPDAISLHAGLAQFRAQQVEVVSMEASSHALHQHRLDGVPISTAIFTNLSRDHLDYHGDMDSYFAAKAKLFLRPELQLAVINTADSRGEQLRKKIADRARVLSYAANDADIYSADWRADATGMTFTLCLPEAQVTCSVPVYGRFNLENLLAVAAVLHGWNYDADDIAAALAHITPVPGRMQRIGTQGPRVLVDYAHTPDGLEKALAAVRDHFSGRLICVVGCGGNRDAGKRPQMAALAEQLADMLVITSDNPRHEAPQAIVADMLGGIRDANAVSVQIDRRLAIEQAVADAGADDVVLIAGKGHETYQEIGAEKLPFDDRVVAAQALQQRGAA